MWEELTGYESVSTISILAAAQEKGIELLLISSANMAEEMEKLNTTDTTKQAVTEAVNAGKIVTIPAEDMTIGSWSGTGYMVIDPETGAGAYMISGGLNGGSLSALLTLEGLCATFSSAAATSMLVWAAVQFFALTLTPFSLVAYGTMLGLLVVAMIALNYEMWTDNLDYLFTGDLSSAEQAADMMGRLGNLALAEVTLTGYINIQYFYARLAKGATHNSTATTVVLGKYNKDGVSYINVAKEKNATYFQLDNWAEIEEIVGNDNMWYINERFLEQQLSQGKNFILSHNPAEADGYFSSEVKFLVEHGYSFIKNGDIWEAIIN